jgi:hypothetical protein
MIDIIGRLLDEAEKADTSAEVVEALIDRHRLVASTWRMTVSDHEHTAATLRALLAERDRLREVLRLTDAALSGANMNMSAVEKKVRAALGEDRA